MADYIGGEAASRILREVMQGIHENESDTPDQAAYRATLVKQVTAIGKVGTTDMPKEWQ